jgi:uncharacterized protein with ATP-grasp and redox domains
VKTYFDCVPCLVRQSLDAIRCHTSDEVIHERLLREVLRAAGEMDLRQPAPRMAQQVHRRIRELSGQSDPYREAKDRFNQLGLEWYPTLRAWIDESDRPMETAVRLAIAGNVIDLGVNSHLSRAEVREAIQHSLSAPLGGDVDEFCCTVATAADILYLTDNAGEIVFDRLLIERLPPGRVTAVVKGLPVINDATMIDAEAAGLTELVEVIDTGSDAPGTILEDCSDAFRQRFAEASLIIAKGQANYETLDQENKDIYFMLKAKCPIIARHIGRQLGSLVLRRSIGAGSAPGPGGGADGSAAGRAGPHERDLQRDMT